MRLLLITLDFGDGGAEKLIVNLANNFSRSGNQVFILSLWDIRKTDYFVEKLDSEVELLTLSKRKGFDYRIFARLWYYISRVNPEIIHTHRSSVNYCLPLIYLKGICHVHTIHNQVEFECPNRIIRFFRRVYLKFYSKSSFVALTKSQYDRALHVYGRRVVLIENGVEDISEGYLSTSGNSAVIVARVSEQKNHTRLFNALERVQGKFDEVKLYVVGRNEIGLDFSKWPFIDFIGSTEDVAPYLLKSSVFLLSSDYEGQPLSVLEALMTGLPVISTPVDSLVEMADSDIPNLYLAEDFSIEAYVAILNNKLKHCLDLSENSRRIIRAKALNKYGIDTCVKSYIDLYEKLLG